MREAARECGVEALQELRAGYTAAKDLTPGRDLKEREGTIGYTDIARCTRVPRGHYPVHLPKPLHGTGRSPAFIPDEPIWVLIGVSGLKPR